MRPRLRPDGTRTNGYRRSATVLALAAAGALAVSGTAFASHTSNVASVPIWNVTPNALPGSGGGGNGGSGATAPVTLTVQTATTFAHPGLPGYGGVTKVLSLLFDNDIVFNLAGVPNCTATFTTDTTIGGPTGAWNKCGPGANEPGEVNAYLSPPGVVSGTASTVPPSNFPGCVLVFKRSATSLLLFARVTEVPNGTANCSTPASNTTGDTSLIMTGTLGSVTNPDWKTRLLVADMDLLPLALDNLKATLKRASVFSARCRDTNKLLNLRATFAYTGYGTQPNDTVNKAKACT